MHLAARAAEADEIVLAQKFLRTAVQKPLVEAAPVVEGQSVEEGAADRRIPDLIEVFLRRDRVPRVKIRRHLPAAQDRDVAGQEVIEGDDRGLFRDAAFGQHVEKILIRVHPRVGAGTADDSLPPLENRLDGVLDGFGDGMGVLLHLVAVIAVAAVSDLKKQLAHRVTRGWAGN